MTTLLSLSATFNAFNQALNNGSQPKDLEFSGAMIYIPNYSSEEEEEAIKPETNAEEKKKPFWKFW